MFGMEWRDFDLSRVGWVFVCLFCEFCACEVGLAFVKLSNVFALCSCVFPPALDGLGFGTE